MFVVAPAAEVFVLWTERPEAAGCGCASPPGGVKAGPESCQNKANVSVYSQRLMTKLSLEGRPLFLKLLPVVQPAVRPLWSFCLEV